MNPSDIFVRTEQGNEAMKDNARLNSKRRVLFIMVDGKLTVEQLLEQCKKLGIDGNMLQLLEQDGYIRNTADAPMPSMPSISNSAVADLSGGAGENFYEVQNFMRQTVADAAGIRSYFFMLKLESAMNMNDLKSLDLLRS